MECIRPKGRLSTGHMHGLQQAIFLRIFAPTSLVAVAWGSVVVGGGYGLRLGRKGERNRRVVGLIGQCLRVIFAANIC
jgi:hypothetical protein